MNNTSERKTNWNFIDDLLSQWRSKFIKPYLSKEHIVCDIGCGQEGKILVSISDLIKEGYGFDFNLKNSTKKRENIFLSNKNFLDCEKKFDIIILLAVLEHIPYPDSVIKLLNDIHKKLNENGVLIMTTPDKRSKKILEFLAYNLHLINEEEIRDHKHYFNKSELLSFLQNSGFKNIKHKHFQFGLNNLVVCKK